MHHLVQDTPVQLVLSEKEMTSLAATYLQQHSPVPIGDVRVRLHPGQIVVVGTAKAAFIPVSVSVSAHPVVVNGQIKLQIESVEPAHLAKIAGISPGQIVDIPLDLQARSVDVAEGQVQMTIAGEAA